MVAAQLILATKVAVTVVLAVAAYGKGGSRRKLDAFAASLEGWGASPLGGWRPVALAVVAAEGIVAVLVVVPATADVGLLLTAALLAAFAAAIAVGTLRRRQVRCLCFGSDGAVLGLRHVVRNVALAGLATTVAAVDATTRADALTPGGVAAALVLGAFGAFLVIHVDDLVGALAPSTSPGR